MEYANALINESSPYLLQHARNPVHWFPWGKEALDKARQEDRLLIVSIGYSSCHWCHVMEGECFEDPGVARLMNQHFVSIKVDREERPDIDQVYMTSVHLTGKPGGWPLNCIALPDGRPFWGGTYFPREQWMSILSEIHRYYRENREQVLALAERLAGGISQQSLILPSERDEMLSKEELAGSMERWSGQFDLEEGGFGSAPKFPMPVNLEFLLHFAVLNKDRSLMDFVELTLLKMARGGIYDQAGGGFARYSVDDRWKVPHFEKMLYDNGQLLGLYASASQVSGRKEFKEVLAQTLHFLQREMTSEEGLFYAALDADSEGEEGKFYTWTREELESLMGEDFELFSAYYQVNERGLWEAERYILLRHQDPREFARKHGLDPGVCEKKIGQWQERLLEARKTRVRPGLDHKSLTSWNSLMISGLVKTHRAGAQDLALQLALKAARAIKDLLWEPGRVLYRNYAGGRASIPGFHIDYALYIQACLDLSEVSSDPGYLNLARELTDLCMKLFFDPGTGMFRFNAIDTEVLISEHIEIQDNVLPSSNAVMAHNLFRLGHLMGDPDFLSISRKMLTEMGERIIQYPGGFACWGKLALMHLFPYYEIVVSGPEAPDMLRQISREYLPQAILSGSTVDSELPVFKGRFLSGKTRIFVCRDHVCESPVESLKDAQAIYQR